MKDVFLIIFVTIFLFMAIIELYFCFHEDDKYRKIFKCFPLFLIAIIILISDYNLYLLTITALLYCLGDFFLLSNHKKWFVIGSISFVLGHIVFLIFAHIHFNISLNSYLYSIPFILLVAILVVIFLFKYLKIKFIGGALVYLGLLTLGMMTNIFELGLVNYEPKRLLIVFGFLIYLISDLMVILKRFASFKKRNDFYIMGTYFLANCLLFGYFVF